MKTVIINGKIIRRHEILSHQNLVIEDGRIACLTEAVPANSVVFDVGGQYVSPGFIDLHTHGAGGYDFMDGTEAAVKGACLEHLRHGTTSIVPTTLTCPLDELRRFFQAYRRVKESWHEGPNLLGVHLEGPFFSSKQCGAQDPRYLKPPTPEEYLPILEAGGGDIVRISLAPELNGALELGDILRSRGIIAAAGHSDATYSQVRDAVAHGFSHVTHLYSGMSALRREGPYRVLGLTESAYLFDELTVEIIADGKHLPPELLRLIMKCKPHDKICLVTDSMRGAGLPDGQRALLGSLSCGQDAIIQDGVAMMPDLNAFAGSVCTADRCVRTMHELADVPLWESVRMMTHNPACLLNLSHRKGSIDAGMDADLVVFDDAVHVSAVFVGGIIRYQK